MNCLRDYLATCDNENVDLNAVSNLMDSTCNYYEPSTRCQFILRYVENLVQLLSNDPSTSTSLLISLCK